ncbi:hypothetical protein [Flavobacterium sp. 3HN19-14]|uniref:hypothetical protein n=1 Tax=Flavobacterium sp. 3HN19-14 TaxID=3448133 RepID=UPI003EE01B73
MIPYKNQNGNSGIIGYEIADNAIRIRFLDGEEYLYTYKTAGKETIEKMKQLAISGKGLATYLNRFASEKYEK